MIHKRATLIPGDHIGRDLAPHVVDLIAAAGAQVEWDWIEVARGTQPGEGTISEACVESVKRNGVALRGPMGTTQDAGYESPSVTLRKRLGLYAGIRAVKNMPGVESRYPDLDLVVIRENTEDVYAGHEHEVVPGVVESLKIVTRTASERIFRFAYKYARRHGRRRVAIIHKANIMKLTDGLWLTVGQEIAADHPDIETRSLIVDNTAMQLVQNPYQFDTLVCGNLYGDLLSDLAAGLVGGFCTVWGEDVGEDSIVFEMIHGRVPELMGKDIANPIPMILPAVKLLEQLDERQAATRIVSAYEKVLGEKKWVTRDLGGTSSTTEMVAAVKGAMA